MLLNCGAEEDSWESLGQQRDQISQSSRKSILKILEGLMIKLKLQYFGQLLQFTHWENPWCWESLKARREGVGAGGWWQKMGWLNIITDPVDMHSSRFQEIMKVRESWCNAVHGVIKSWYDLVTEQQKCWSTWVQQWINACLWLCSITQSCLTVCQPHELQYTRLPYPSPSTRACSNSYPWLGK